MYFSLIPDIKQPVRPISFPFSESEYITAKNFFRRYQVNPDIFEYAVYFTKYAIEEGAIDLIILQLKYMAIHFMIGLLY